MIWRGHDLKVRGSEVNQSLIDLTELLPDIYSSVFSPYIFCRDAKGGGDVARKGRKHMTRQETYSGAWHVIVNDMHRLL
jgi:hypothetical protein